MTPENNQQQSSEKTSDEKKAPNIEHGAETKEPLRKKPISSGKYDKFHSALGGWDRFWSFVSSGLFFMLFGSTILFLAYKTMTHTHSSFTFVLVVVGIAILLYGTGTQGAGEFASENGGTRYKAAIAGGAGLLAFAIGVGMILNHKDIKATFGIQQKYVRIPLFNESNNEDLANYIAVATVGGMNVPTVLRGKVIEIYAPYLAGQEESTVIISVNVNLYNYKIDPKTRMPIERDQDITFSDADLDIDSGFEFPRVKMKKGIRISFLESVSSNSATTDTDKLGNKSPLPPPSTTQFR